jgi:rod shape determining protein RodA
MLLSVLAISACAYLAQGSTARALAAPGFAHRQLIWLVVGVALLLLFSFADYRVLARFSPLFYVVSIAVLLVLFVVAPLRGGTRSWIAVGSYTVQPSEFARVVTILGVAALADEYRQSRLNFPAVWCITAVVAAPALLVLLQPDLGMALTFVPILLAALWLGGLRWRTWIALVLAGVVFVAAAWLWFLKPYQRERVLTFADPQRAPYSSGYQQRQSKIAVGSGEITGKGLHSGTQSQLRFLPAQYTDFIFAVWAEETGFVGAAFLLAAYTLLIVRIFVVALAARDRVGAVFAGCAGFVMSTAILINIGMVTGLAPTTGITLPLLSYGGSSVLATCITLGIVQSIWRLRFANV